MRNFVARRRMTRTDWILTSVAGFCGGLAIAAAWFGLPFIGVHL